jgi:fucose 4-O-acetylase-like acetyltransferase
MISEIGAQSESYRRNSVRKSILEINNESVVQKIKGKPFLTPRLFELILIDGSSRLYTLGMHQIVFVTMELPNCSIIAILYSSLMMIIIFLNIIILIISTEPQFT